MSTELLALVSSRDDIIASVQACLRGYSVYPVKDLTEFDELLINIPVGCLILDSLAVRISQIDELTQSISYPLIVIADDHFDPSRLTNAPEVVPESTMFRDLPRAIEKLTEINRLENEIRTLREGTKNPQQGFSGYPAPHEMHSPSKSMVHERVLLNFAKTLSVNFNLKKLLNHFMDSVIEIVRVNKMSIMLREKNVFTIWAQTGIDPYFAENIKLTNDSPLIKWLASNGRIFGKSLNINYQAHPEILKEMEVLQCYFSFPMIYKGKLIGIFNMGSKITGDPFSKEELEMIFLLSNYLSAAIKDIDSYHQIQYQKEFTKNILANMNSGVITINADEQISVFNQRAAEILKLNSLDMMGSDLRKLPSPLGDILFETMSIGRAYNRHEISIKPGNIPLGISSYRLADENRKPIGAVIVFTDLSDLKRLRDEQRKSEKLEAVNNLVAKIAHEIKNPLTSIQTFTQLLKDKYADEEFRNFFALTVMQSVQQLDNLIDKLVLFSNPLDFHPGKYAVNDIFDEVMPLTTRDLPDGVKLLREGMDKDIFVNIDKNLFIKALYYLILASADKSPKNDYILLQAGEQGDTIEISLKFSGPPLSQEEKEVLLRPLLDIDAFGIELNIPLSQKIIEEHHGTLAIVSADGYNALVITLPAFGKSEMQLHRDNIHG